MSQNIEILCDQCGADLTYAGNSVDYRIVLASQPIPSRGGAVTDMMIWDPLKTSAHFCNWRCVEEWFAHRAEVQAKDVPRA